MLLDDEEENDLYAKEEIEQIRKSVREKIPQFSSTEIRNVLFVGKTRAGKSTYIGVLDDLAFQPKNFGHQVCTIPQVLCGKRRRADVYF